MVFLKIKNSETDYFMFESTTTQLIDEIIKQLVEVWNLRIQLRQIISEAKELVKYGVAKPLEEQGLDESMKNLEISETEKTKEKKEDPNKDPTGRRVGEAPKEEYAKTINKTIEAAEALLSRQAADRKECLTKEKLLEAMRNIEGSIKMAYPMGLPKDDPLNHLFDKEYRHHDMFDQEKATLWFAGKELYRDTKLMDNKSIGKNEKTMIIAKLQKKGQGPPAREPVVDSETQKNLMAYWYRKQEEHKKLMEADDDSYYNSEWANPKGLRNAFLGLGDISWKPK